MSLLSTRRFVFLFFASAFIHFIPIDCDMPCFFLFVVLLHWQCHDFDFFSTKSGNRANVDSALPIPQFSASRFFFFSIRRTCKANIYIVSSFQVVILFSISNSNSSALFADRSFALLQRNKFSRQCFSFTLN